MTDHTITNRHLVLFTFIRFIVNINQRMVYPFLTAISRGLGVPLQTLAWSTSLRSFTGVLSPFISTFADRYGRKPVILGGVGMVMLGLTLFISLPTFPVFVLYICLAYLGAFSSMVALQAYISDRVVLRARGRYLSTMELGWSLAFIIGMPAVAVMIEKGSWRTPFPILLLVTAISMIPFARSIQVNQRMPAAPETDAWWKRISQVLANPQARRILLAYLTLTVPGEMLLLVFGPWLEASFQFKILALGISSFVIGIAEFCGESLSAQISDRLGKRRVVMGAVIANSIVVLSILVIGRTPVGALIGLFLFYMCIEFAYISGIPLVAEVMQDARATVLGLNGSTIAIARAGAALMAPAMLQLGMPAVAGVCILSNMLTLWLLSRFQLPTGASEAPGAAAHPA